MSLRVPSSSVRVELDRRLGEIMSEMEDLNVVRAAKRPPQEVQLRTMGHVLVHPRGRGRLFLKMNQFRGRPLASKLKLKSHHEILSSWRLGVTKRIEF